MFTLPSPAFFLLLLGMAISSCQSGLKSDVDSTPEAYSKPNLVHAIHSEKLRKIMIDLKGLAYDRLPQEMEIQEERTRHFERISQTADAMARYAPRIAETLSELDLRDNERRTFLELVEHLKTHALELRRHAAMGKWPETIEAMEAVKSTCAACHDLFRSLPKGKVSPP